MVRRVLLRMAVVGVALLGARSAWASALTPATTPGTTGNVAADFPTSNPNVQVAAISDPLDRVAQQQWMTNQGWVTGWNIKDVRTIYDPKTDTMAVGINFFGIAGDADGNGNPGAADPRTLAAGGVDMPQLGGHESITIGIDPNHSGKPFLVAGVPADKSTAGTGTDGFNVALYKNSSQGIAYSYGQTLNSQMGQLLYDPSAAHPGFEFTIKNFSKIPGINLNKGYWLEAFAGSPDDVVAGEDQLPWTNFAIPNPQIIVPPSTPEPVSVLGWSFLIAGAGWQLRRFRRQAA